jgi:hypothetical protein
MSFPSLKSSQAPPKNSGGFCSAIIIELGRVWNTATSVIPKLLTLCNNMLIDNTLQKNENFESSSPRFKP